MFIISEISPQFGTDLDLAEQMILQSKLSGANAVKLQLYPVSKFFEDPSPYIRDRELDFEGFKRLKEYGDKIGIPTFATAFTEGMLDWCIELDQKYYKIAARMHREDPELVDKVVALKKPTFVSYGHDFDSGKVRQDEHCVNLFCVSNYPTLLEDVNLPDFRSSPFVGYSDHSIGISAAIYAASKGCQYLEKHFTTSHALQASVEKAHLGSMTMEDLMLIKRISGDFSRIGVKL